MLVSGWSLPLCLRRWGTAGAGLTAAQLAPGGAPLQGARLAAGKGGGAEGRAPTRQEKRSVRGQGWSEMSVDQLASPEVSGTMTMQQPLHLVHHGHHPFLGN